MTTIDDNGKPLKLISPFWGRGGGWNHTDPEHLIRSHAERKNVKEPLSSGALQLKHQYEDMVEYARLYADPVTRNRIPLYM